MESIIAQAVQFANENPSLIYTGLSLAAISFIISIAKKAMSAAAFLFIIGFLVATIQPIGTQIMEQAGVSYNETSISITTIDGSIKTYEWDKIEYIDLKENEDGSYVVSLTVDEAGEQSIVIPKETASWVKGCISLAENITQAGANFATNGIS